MRWGGVAQGFHLLPLPLCLTSAPHPHPEPHPTCLPYACHTSHLMPIWIAYCFEMTIPRDSLFSIPIYSDSVYQISSCFLYIIIESKRCSLSQKEYKQTIYYLCYYCVPCVVFMIWEILATALKLKLRQTCMWKSEKNQDKIIFIRAMFWPSWQRDFYSYISCDEKNGQE